MDWETDTSTPTTAGEKEKTRLEKLGGLLGTVGNALGQHIGNGNGHEHRDGSEIMIGMFMHTPWPSSEIFRCLPSELT